MIGRASFIALLVLALTLPAHAQLPFARPQGDAPAKVAAPETIDPRVQVEGQLAEARRQQEAALLEDRGATGAEGLAATDRHRLLDRLVVAYSERLKVLEDLQRLKTFPPESPQQHWLTEFTGPPPYSALRVDALRDDLDATRARLQSLASNERALETLKVGRIDAQRRASEAVRLAEDKLARLNAQEDIEKERLNRDLAALRRQLAEAELANIGLGLEKFRLEMTGLQTLSTKLEHLLTRILPEQRLSKEELEHQQALLRRELNTLNQEGDAIVSANTRLAAERQQLARLMAQPGSDSPAAGRLQLLDARLETDRVLLMANNWLQTLVQAASDAWAQRYVGFHSDDTGTRQAVIDGLSGTREEIGSRRQIVEELHRTASIELREQQLRLDGATLDAITQAQESALLEALKERVATYERVARTATRLHRQLDSWLEDFGFRGMSTSSEDWRLFALRLAQKLKAIWEFEMFAVEDSTVVDGKTVTVAYGVTVGKSIGALVLFLLGYGLFALLSRHLQRLMVSRFGVKEQVASVIRRWAMIALAVVLVVFILNLARIPLTVFAFLGGALAIGIGFGTQTIIKNVISGIIILFERKIRVGDIIALGGMTGHVIAVDLRASTVRGFDGVEALVPNSSFLENQVVNWTYSNPRIRREIRVGLAYGSPVRRAAEVITGCAEDHGQILKNPAPEVFFEDFADSSLLMVLVYWVELGENLNSRRVDSDLRYAIEKRLAAAGIEMPFPQRDVHLDMAQPLPVRIAPASEP